jgi:hypothetical protein
MPTRIGRIGSCSYSDGEEEVMSIPTPQERPDLYDGYDFQEPRSPASQKYWDSVMPDHVKKAIAERANKNVKVPNE